jgi:hypothetical protein
MRVVLLAVLGMGLLSKWKVRDPVSDIGRVNSPSMGVMVRDYR